MRCALPAALLVLVGIALTLDHGPVAGAAGALPGDYVRFSLLSIGGAPTSAAITNSGVRIRGLVRPFVAGQSVLVRVTGAGHRLTNRVAEVRDAGDGLGRFSASLATGKRTGTLSITVQRPAAPLQAALTAPARRLEVVAPNAPRGSRGPSLRLLQRSLARLHYAVSRTGIFDATTARAVETFRKLTGLARTQQANSRVFELLGRGAGAFRPRNLKQGPHFEADLSHQVLAEVTSGGHVRRVYPMSSGKPSTPTVIGTFHIYSKTPGTNAKGMVDASYFVGGYAIHGFADVPPYAASHGCLRIPLADAAAVSQWARYGYAVDVYTRRGRGSHRVQRNAGP